MEIICPGRYLTKIRNLSNKFWFLDVIHGKISEFFKKHSLQKSKTSRILIKKTQKAKMLLYYELRDANFYGLPVVTTENCKNFQFSTDYGKLLFFYGNFLKK